MNPTSASLLERLRHADPKVRRIAAMDLRPLAPDDAALNAIAEHVSLETDESTLVTLIRWLGRTNDPRVMPALRRLRADPACPARAAHAAILAYDGIELAGRNT